MSETQLWQQATAKVPPHVPPELVKNVDLWSRPEGGECPFHKVKRVQDEYPRIFYNLFDPQCGSSWFLTRDEDIRQVLTDPATWSSNGVAGLSALIGEDWLVNPLEIDPPEHRKFRTLLNPFFQPSAIAKMGDGVRERAVRLIEKIKNDGGCEFMAAFSVPFPVGVFLQIMGLPEEHLETLCGWNNDLNHDTTIPVKVAAAQKIVGYLRNLRDDRRKIPVNDLASHIVQAEIDGRKLGDNDVLGVYFAVFIAGLDTVASALSLIFRHLAAHPELQDRLRREPAIIPAAIEEFMRRFSPVMTRRKAIVDTTVAGQTIRAGEWVTLITGFAGQDETKYENPLDVDFDRKNNFHLGFATGPHVCLGVQLARREMLIALEEWTQRLPNFRLKPGFEPPMKNGGVVGAEKLELVW